MGETNRLKVVVDASVMLKFVTVEAEDLDQSMRLRDDIASATVEAYIPVFCLHESASTIARLRLPYLDYADVFGLYKALRVLGCQEVDLSDFYVMDAYKLLKGTPKASFYDAIYHVLALYLGAMFITADKKYYDLMRHKGHIKLLKDY